MEKDKSIKEKLTYDKRVQKPECVTMDDLADQINNLEGQDFFMSIPIGGEEYGI